jgi:hypothetical protein
MKAPTLRSTGRLSVSVIIPVLLGWIWATSPVSAAPPVTATDSSSLQGKARLVADEDIPLVAPNGRVSFASPNAGRASPEAYNPHAAGSRGVNTQGRAGVPTARGKLPPDGAAQGRTNLPRVPKPRPVAEQGRVGAPGSMPSADSLAEPGAAVAASVTAPPRPAHYVPRPVVQEGRVGAPGTMPTPKELERSERAARSPTDGNNPNGKYLQRPPVQLGRVKAPGTEPPRSETIVDARGGAPRFAPPPYVPRPNVQLGRVKGPGNPDSAAIILHDTTAGKGSSDPSQRTFVYVPRPAVQTGRATALANPRAGPIAPSEVAKSTVQHMGRATQPTSAPVTRQATHATDTGRAGSFIVPQPAVGAPAGAAAATAAGGLNTGRANPTATSAGPAPGNVATQQPTPTNRTLAATPTRKPATRSKLLPSSVTASKTPATAPTSPAQ